MSVSLPWNKINDFLLDCGGIRDPVEFSKAILNRIDALIPFDEACLYFLDDNGRYSTVKIAQRLRKCCPSLVENARDL